MPKTKRGKADQPQVTARALRRTVRQLEEARDRFLTRERVARAAYEAAVGSVRDPASWAATWKQYVAAEKPLRAAWEGVSQASWEEYKADVRAAWEEGKT